MEVSQREQTRLEILDAVKLADLRLAVMAREINEVRKALSRAKSLLEKTPRSDPNDGPKDGA